MAGKEEANHSTSTPEGGATLWLTGRPASGKSTIAEALEVALRALGAAAARLDGDELRRTSCRDLGFSRRDRAENARRAGDQALEIARRGELAIVSLVSPFAEDRQAVRARHAGARIPFVEVHVACSLELAERRDPKGLYRRARAGEIQGLSGLDAPYEVPATPDIVLDTGLLSLEDETRALIDHLRRRGILAASA